MSGGAYGDVLSAFPELFNDYSVFDMQTTVSGYGPRTNQRIVSGVFRKVPGGKMGVVSENRQPNAVGSFWCYEDDSSIIGQGAYIEVKGDIYILTKDNGYIDEAGFSKYIAGKVVGPDGRQKENKAVTEKFLNDFK